MKIAPIFALIYLLSASTFAADLQTIAATVTGAKPPPAKTFDVASFGAKADGLAKDTDALQKALDACAQNGGGQVDLAPGTYLTGSLTIGSNTTLHLAQGATLQGSPDIADYPLMKVRWEGEWRDGHRALLSSEKTQNVAITGPGIIQGPPLALASLRPDNRGNVRGPAIFEPIDVAGLTLEDFTLHYQRMWSIHMTYCENVHINHLTIRTTQTNGDGIDVDSSSHVLIENCDIDTGDDAICLKSGRGMEAVRIAKPADDILIRDCTLSSDFAGLGIGTEMSGGIRNVLLQHCTFLRCRQNAIFIKSRTGRGGFIDNLTGENLDIKAQCGTFLGIDLVTKGIQATEPVTGDDQWPRVSNITFRNIKVDNVPTLVEARNISPERPLDHFTLSTLTGTARQGIHLTNTTHATLENIQITLQRDPLLTLTNVQGENLDEPSVRHKP